MATIAKRSTGSLLVPGAILVLAVLLALYLMHPYLSFVILLFGAGLAFFALKIGAKAQEEEAAEETVKAESAAEALKRAPIEKLRKVTTVADELTVDLRSILQIGERLLFYDVENSPVVAEILRAYDGFIRQYLEGAAKYAAVYRNAKAYIKERNTGTISSEIKTLEKRMASGENGLERTLEEKKKTLHRVGGMAEGQPDIRNGIQTIQATLESLEASIKEAEADPSRMKDIMDEIQLTLSSTGTAIEKTLVAVKSNERVFAKEAQV